jgi:phosphate uptake regulator
MRRRGVRKREVLAKQEKERRKVQISGKSSCMVALPKKWVKDMGLEQGSEVTIARVNPRSLLVSVQGDTQLGTGREAVVDVGTGDTPESIFRKIVSLYVLGFTRIIVECSRGSLGVSKKAVLRDLVRRHLIGTESVAEARERVTVHVLLGYSELSVEGAMRKMLMIIDSLGKDAVFALVGDDPTLAAAAPEREDEVARFGLYVIRQLNLSVSQDAVSDLRLENRDTLGYIIIARILDRIASHAGSMIRATGGVGAPLSRLLTQKLSSMTEEACALADEAMLSLFKRDHRGADLVIERSKTFVQRSAEATRLINEEDPRTFYSLHVLLDSQKRIAEYAREIAETVLDMTVERTLREQELAPQRAPMQYA